MTGLKKLLILLAAGASPVLVHHALKASDADYVNNGETVPKPVFQVGDNPSEPYADGSSQAQGFLDFYNKTYLDSDTQLQPLTKKDVVWMPPQLAGDTSLELVARALPGQESNCPTPGTGDGTQPETYPLYCEDSFSTGEFCKACHDSVLFVEGGGLQQMAYFSEKYGEGDHQEWLANWSQYGDWSANIMRLATRDPIWQAQIETETNQHKFADPHVIQDVCFSCHGEMGERQLKMDLGDDQVFCTDLFYATIPGYLSEHQKGAPFPFSGDCAPVPGHPITEDNQREYAKYGSLARDGVSCETCHRIGPENGGGQWNGTDFEVFYGKKDLYNVAQRQTDNPVPLEYEFTANFEVDMNNIMAPDKVEDLDLTPMAVDDNLILAQGYNQKDHVSYMGQSVLCGACHVLIVPQIPSAFKPDGPLPDKNIYPYYDKPDACTSDKFAPATRGQYGNPVTDDCVGLGYEQATYLEWINSDFASEEDNENTCQACHMPLVTDPNDPNNHKAIMAQSTHGLTPKDYRRHRLMGINLPVFEMFIQFPDVLGVAPFDDLVPPSGITNEGKEAPFIQNYLLNGEMAIVEQATSQANGNGLLPNSVTPDPQAATSLSITNFHTTPDTLFADLTITNNTGHKFPSGAGFRRAFIKFEVLDANENVIWVSGATNPYGAICEGACVETGPGTYNLLASEVTNGDPQKLQPHHQIITSDSQVQIYEVQAVNDDGKLTSRTLSLFHDAKDNRLLPKGFVGPEQLGCKDNPNAGTEIFGIKQCSAAYATEPQLNPLTIGSMIGTDPHYTNSAYAGSDSLSYQIPLSDIKGTPKSVRATMEYQTIPPGFLASRFKDGNTGNGFLPATERAIYLTSHLNTNLPLKSEHPDNKDLTFSKNWTTSIYQTTASLAANEMVNCRVFGDGYSNMTKLSDAIYSNSPYKMCVPDGTSEGSCNKWFGRCEVQSTGEKVNFKVYNQGGANASGFTDAVYVPLNKTACEPDGTSSGNCKYAFGQAATDSGKSVQCRLFNDGYTDQTDFTDGIIAQANGQVCFESDLSQCRKWFGRCEVMGD